MPIYEYQCADCDQRHEVIQGINDPELTDCPKCGKPSLKRLISAAGFRLKGSGWYETDFKSGNKRNLADSGSDSAAKSTGTDD
ncbi:MAG: zinc ribbon domain-containing protein [Gammaproteobacteria bacterium]